ncbi:hypothetical protein TNCV_1542691 [Trichonephila clavipes]|nr:hypothetical protein TNCV_1542691 [Trichonephila clavipes]
MGRSDATIRRCWKKWMDSDRFQRHDGSGQPRASADRKDRLIWCLARSGWNHAYKGRIVSSDESRFQLCPDDHRRGVWGHPGQRADLAFIISRLNQELWSGVPSLLTA